MKKFLAIIGVILLEILILTGVIFVNVEIAMSDLTFFQMFLFICLFIFGVISIGFCIIIISLILGYD